jgi:L-asparaginase
VRDPAVREVTVLAAGGTIAMTHRDGGDAVPRLDADALVQAVPALGGVPGLRMRTINTRPSVQLSAAEALDIARAAAVEADGGRGVVVTHGTDTLEEVALLCDLLYGGEAPIVFTGAMRHASALGADGPANLFDAVVVGGADGAEGLGVLIVFAGAVHAARAVRKADSTAPAAFDSPRLGPIGRVQEGRAWMARRLERFPPVPVASLDATVHIVPAALGADGSLVDAALEAGADGLVGVVLGAGHTPPPFLAALKRAAARVPVVVTVRPERGSILHGTYAFEGAERDLRSGPLICAAALSPAAARIKLMACIGAGYARGAVAGAFGPDDF